jgi:archaellum component FlaG (FlaF/FlaG flagellin family)
MKLIQLLLVPFCLLFIISSAKAQGILTFEKETHEFGNLTEGVQATYAFKFKNTGNQPVVISNVQPSCGCTTPDWTKEPILPGKSGMVKAVYNSSGRPGAFHKAITVTSNASTPTQVLFIKGSVLEKAAVKVEYTPEEKARSPRLSLLNTTHDFGKLEAGQKAQAQFKIKNTGKQPLTLQGIQAACNCVNYKIATPTILPGKEEILELTYSQRVLGEQTEKVSLITNDIVSAATQLTLKAKVVPTLNTTSIIKESSSAVPFK